MAKSTTPKKVNIFDYLAQNLGAVREVHTRSLFVVYIPNMDFKGDPIPNHAFWVKEAQRVLGQIFGGTTTYITHGSYRGSKGIIYEETHLVESFMKDPRHLVDNILEIKELLHEFGRVGKQESVAFRYNGVFFEIYKTEYEKE